MKTFKRTFVPDQIKYNGKIYKVNVTISAGMQLSRTDPKKVITATKSTGKSAILVQVLNSNLKGIRDLHGNFYQPTNWIFISE